MRRACCAIAELASRRRKILKIGRPSDALRKTWMVLPLRGIWVVCLMEWYFGHGQGPISIELAGWGSQDFGAVRVLVKVRERERGVALSFEPFAILSLIMLRSGL